MSNKRLAKGIDGIERPWTPHERYMLYCRGFRDGAGIKAMSDECKGLDDYDRGYADGCKARSGAAARFAKKIGYKPTVLRTAT